MTGIPDSNNNQKLDGKDIVAALTAKDARIHSIFDGLKDYADGVAKNIKGVSGKQLEDYLKSAFDPITKTYNETIAKDKYDFDPKVFPKGVTLTNDDVRDILHYYNTKIPVKKAANSK